MCVIQVTATVCDKRHPTTILAFASQDARVSQLEGSEMLISRRDRAGYGMKGFNQARNVALAVEQTKWPSFLVYFFLKQQ